MSYDRRPADHQIHVIAKCYHCQREDEYDFDPTGSNCGYGYNGTLKRIGESYPGDTQDWDEVRTDRGYYNKRTGRFSDDRY